MIMKTNTVIIVAVVVIVVLGITVVRQDHQLALYREALSPGGGSE